MADYLFSRLDAVLPRLAVAPRVLCGLDFDGTLTPIVDDRRHAHLSPEMTALLARLAARPNCLVAIVSGRALEDVRSRIPVPGLIFAGNHGLDIDGPGLRFTESSAEQFRPQLLVAAERLRAELAGIPGTLVEDKGLTLTVHFRQANPDDETAVRKAVVGVIAEYGNSIRLTLGHMAYEVRPPTAWNKGHALDLIRRHYHCEEADVLYVGDDTTDEDAFASLPDAVTVKVGDSANTSARFCVESPAEVERFLGRLADLAARSGA